MRKLTAAGIIAASALGLSLGGLSLQASAATTVYTITGGTFSSTEASCTQITSKFAGVDCTYGRNRPGTTGAWIGYLFGGGHYARGGPADSPEYAPTTGVEDPPLSGTFVPAADDGKIEATVTGTLSIDDNGTPANPADDKISSNFSIGPMVRNVATGQITRAVQGWTSMDHQMAAITVSSAVGNGNGGIDYVIGSRGFPAPQCSATDASDCFPTQNAMNSFDESPFYADIAEGSVGIERVGLMGEPNFVLVLPPPNPPTGNVGATSTATFTDVTCVYKNTQQDDCVVSPLVWGGGEDAGFDNIVMKVSTDGTGAITSALAYYTQEYRIGFGAAGEPGYDNSAGAGTFSFTAPAPNTGAAANNFAASVLQGSSNNTLDAASNCTGFPGAVTVSIVTGPTLGTATVNGGNQTINYNSTGAAGTDSIVYQCTSGAASDQGTITVTVAPDAQPVAPDGAISISTLGAAPGPGTAGSLNVSTLGGYSAGNAPSVVSITTAPAPASGTAAVTGTTITFTPAATFFTGTATIGYTITDNDGDAESGVITVTIPDVTPVLSDGSIATDQDTTSAPRALVITPGNGTVAQSTVIVSTQPTQGTCAITGTASAPSVTYTPNDGYVGTDSCVVKITDGNGSEDTGTISITVTEVSDALKLPGGGGALDLWSLSLLGTLPLLRRRRRA